MKKRKLNKKLTLNHETLLRLDGAPLANVVGQKGLTEPCLDPTTACTLGCSGAFPC